MPTQDRALRLLTCRANDRPGGAKHGALDQKRRLVPCWDRSRSTSMGRRESRTESVAFQRSREMRCNFAFLSQRNLSPGSTLILAATQHRGDVVLSRSNFLRSPIFPKTTLRWTRALSGTNARCWQSGTISWCLRSHYAPNDKAQV